MLKVENNTNIFEIIVILYYKMLMNKYAIYDIDYTIISTNSLFDVIIFLIKKKPYKIIYLPFLIFISSFWFIKTFSLERIKSFWLLPFSGIKVDDLDLYSKEFIDKIIVPKIKKGALDSINENKKKGYKIILATASFEFYIKYLAEYLGADFYFGTKVKIINSKIKSELDGMNCKSYEKIKRILKVIPENKMNKAESISYSDSKTDLPFLELADTFYQIDRIKWKIRNKIVKS